MAAKKTAKRCSCANKPKAPKRSSSKLYVWEWIGGGHNDCHAGSPAEALRKAVAMAKHTTLKVDKKTLRVASRALVAKLDRQYGFD